MTLNTRLARLEQQAEPDDTLPRMTVEEIVGILADLDHDCQAAGYPASPASSTCEIAQRLWAERSMYPGFLRSIGYGSEPKETQP